MLSRMNNNAEIIKEVRAAFVAMFNDTYDYACRAYPNSELHDMHPTRLFRRFMDWQESYVYFDIHAKHGFKQVGKGAARIGFEYTMKNGTVVAVKVDYRSDHDIEMDRIGNAWDMMNHEAIINRFPDAKELLVETHGSFELYDTMILVQECMLLGIEYDGVYMNAENKLRRAAIASLSYDVIGNEWNYGYTKAGVLKVIDLDRLCDHKFNAPSSDHGMQVWRNFIAEKHLKAAAPKKPRAPRKPRIKKLTPVEA